jgi:cytidylate kinase
MTSHTYLEHGLSILKNRLRPPTSELPHPSSQVAPFITISREACAGATTLGRALVPLLDEHFGETGRNWMLLDKDLITHALTHHQLPERLAAFLPEDRISDVKSLIGELVGLHPSLWELEHKVSEAILMLAHLGRVIFVGRAAHLVTRSLEGGFHLRLVAPMEVRIRRMMALQSIEAAAAKVALLESDRARHRYTQRVFGQDLSDPHAYDLLINTERFTPQTAANLVLAALRERFGAGSQLEHAAEAASGV